MKDALTGNAADEEQVKGAKRREKQQRRQEVLDLESVLSLPGGRSFIWRLLASCGCFEQSYVPGDSYATAFNEGRRGVGNPLLAEITNEFPEHYLRMMKEAKGEKGNG